MKKIYLLATSVLLFATASQAQIVYEDDFDNDLVGDFINPAPEFTLNQEGSDLTIFSEGHDEWSVVNYTLHNGTDGTPIAMTSEDTLFIRVRVETEDEISPVLAFGIVDENGTTPNNASYNDQNTITLTNEYQIIKIVGVDWANTFGDGMITDTNNITSINIAPNPGFASPFPKTNSEGVVVNAAFNGTIYIDYVMFQGGEPLGLTRNTNQKLDFFPNPASNVINITNTELVSGQDYTITNLLGVEVANGQITDSGLDISALSAGTYLISTSKNGINYSSRIIVE